MKKVAIFNFFFKTQEEWQALIQWLDANCKGWMFTFRHSEMCDAILDDWSGRTNARIMVDEIHAAKIMLTYADPAPALIKTTEKASPGERLIGHMLSQDPGRADEFCAETMDDATRAMIRRRVTELRAAFTA